MDLIADVFGDAVGALPVATGTLNEMAAGKGPSVAVYPNGVAIRVEPRRDSSGVRVLKLYRNANDPKVYWAWLRVTGKFGPEEIRNVKYSICCPFSDTMSGRLDPVLVKMLVAGAHADYRIA